MKPLPTSKPPGEDFFLWSVRIASPDPNWDSGFMTFGTWSATAPAIAQWARVQSKKTLDKTTILLTQGEAARAKLPEMIEGERRYQEFQRNIDKN